MPDNLRLYHSTFNRMAKFLPTVRVTRLRNLALMVTGLFLSRSVHLNYIARKWPVAAKLHSLEIRLRRFCANVRLDVDRLYRPVRELLMTRFQGGSAPLRLILDVTRIGPVCRLFTIAIAYRKRALPLVWSVHKGVKGHVSVKAQLALLDQIRPLIEPGTEVWVYGDSAFGQVEVMRYFEQLGWKFVLRLNGHYQIRQSGAWQRLCDLGLEPGQTRYVGEVSLTEKHAYRTNLVLHWDQEEDEPWFLASSELVSRRTLRRYRVRFWTEELYGDLKGHGFDLETTRLRAPRRLERLVLGVCWAFVWLIALGSWVVKRGLRHLVDRRDRRDKSYFRIGWDYLEHCNRLGLAIPVRYEPYP